MDYSILLTIPDRVPPVLAAAGAFARGVAAVIWAWRSRPQPSNIGLPPCPSNQPTPVANSAASPAPVILAAATEPRAAAKQARQLPTPVNKRPTLNSPPVSVRLTLQALAVDHRATASNGPFAQFCSC